MQYQNPPAYPASPAYSTYPPVRRRRRWYWRCGCCLMGVLLLLLTPFFCLGGAFLTYKIAPPEPITIVILGIDARPGEGSVTRTDSIMLLNINPGENDVTLLSIPRDVFISVPGYGDERINTINVLGEMEAEGHGPELLKASFQQSFGIDVDYFVRLDFSAFTEIVDAVGGVDVEVPKQIIDYEYPTADGGTIMIQFDPGKQHMDGERALQYARTRHADDDYQRAGRQQQVLDALIHKLASPTQFHNWPQIVNIIKDHTDTDMSTAVMVEMGPALLMGWSGRTSRVLQREDLISWKDGYVTPDYDALSPWMTEHFK